MGFWPCPPNCYYSSDNHLRWVMQFSIEYCVRWDYGPRALRVRDYLVERFGASVELIESSGGAFEIMRDGTLIFSKHETDRFPSNDELEYFGSPWPWRRQARLPSARCARLEGVAYRYPPPGQLLGNAPLGAGRSLGCRSAVYRRRRVRIFTDSWILDDTGWIVFHRHGSAGFAQTPAHLDQRSQTCLAASWGRHLERFRMKMNHLTGMILPRG